MKQGWQYYSLADVCSIESKLVDPRDQAFLDLPHIGAGNIESDTGGLINIKTVRDEQLISGKFVFDESMVLYSKIRPYLRKVARPSFGGLCSADVYPLAPNPQKIGRDFLFYLLLSDAFTEFATKGSARVGMPKVNREHLFSYVVSLPSLSEQRCIVEILDEAFEAIGTAKGNAERSLQNARASFVGYLQSVFAGAGDGWSVSRVGAVADCCLGKMLDKAKNKGDMKPYLRNLNVRWFGFDMSDVQEMRFTPDEYERYSVRQGDVVICEGGYPGRAAIWEDEETIFIQKALHRVRFPDPVLGRWFLYYLYSQEASGALRQYFTGTGIQHFTGAALSRLSLPLAPRDVAGKLVERFDGLALAVSNLEAIYRSKIASIDELKKSLLHHAFTGQLTAKKTDQLLGAAV